MIKKVWLILVVCCLLCLDSVQALAQASFVTVEDGALMEQGGEVFGIKGMQMWYAPLLATKGSFENKERLKTELDSLKALGVNCISVWPNVQADSKSNGFAPSKDISGKELQGLDYVLNELQLRGMRTIINVNMDEKVRFLILRKNGLNNLLYKDDPTILAWQLCQTSRKETLNLNHIQQVGNAIKDLDPNHLFTVNYIPIANARSDEQTYESLLSLDCVDWVTMSIKPFDLGWVNEGSLIDGLGFVCLHTGERMETYTRIANKIEKPWVVEISYPRDGMFRLPQSKTEARNAFFSYICTLQKYAMSDNPTPGIIFDGWGGDAQTTAESWQINDAPTAEFSTAKKGVYSIYNSDTETKVIIKSAF